VSPSLAPTSLQSHDPIQALFAEARRRRRRIRLTGLALSLALAVAAAVISAAVISHAPKPRDARRGPAGSTGVAGTAAGSPLVAWVDADFRLHLGDLATRTQHVVAEINADPGMPLVQVAGRLYWINQGGGYTQGAFWPTTVEELNLATGKSTDIGPGEFVFPSADGRHLYISQTDNSLAEVPVRGPARQSEELTLPAGWYLPGGYSLAVANGSIVVQSNDDQAIRHPPQIAVWDPRTGLLRVIGKGVSAPWGSPMGAAIGAYTPPRAGYSLLAWMPASCQYPLSCPIKITNTSTLASLTLRSPFPHGFALGGAFSPDGKQLAVFVNRSPGDGGGTAELAIADTATGALRIVASAHYPVGEDIGWARWLPGGNQLIVIGADDPYLISTQTLSARSLGFVHRGAQSINFSVIVIPHRS
jgi:hypothetical protein